VLLGAPRAPPDPPLLWPRSAGGPALPLCRRKAAKLRRHIILRPMLLCRLLLLLLWSPRRRGVAWGRGVAGRRGSGGGGGQLLSSYRIDLERRQRGGGVRGREGWNDKPTLSVSINNRKPAVGYKVPGPKHLHYLSGFSRMTHTHTFFPPI
jgi:hypothetical protein